MLKEILYLSLETCCDKRCCDRRRNWLVHNFFLWKQLNFLYLNQYLGRKEPPLAFVHVFLIASLEEDSTSDQWDISLELCHWTSSLGRINIKYLQDMKWVTVAAAMGSTHTLDKWVLNRNQGAKFTRVFLGEPSTELWVCEAKSTFFQEPWLLQIAIFMAGGCMGGLQWSLLTTFLWHC